MNTIEITIQHKSGSTWPVVADFLEANSLPVRFAAELSLPENWDEDLLSKFGDSTEYGNTLGKALFQGQILHGLTTARARSQDRLQFMLCVEAPDLKHLHWERLRGPIRVNDRFGFFALDQRFVFSLYLPSPADRRFPSIGRRDLKALVFVANPPQGNNARLDRFDEEATLIAVREALGDIPHDYLGTAPGAAAMPTLNNLVGFLTRNYYSMLHIVAHGWFRSKDGETILYLLDDDGKVKAVSASDLLDRLDQIQGVRGLPHFTFLCTCDSANPQAEYAGAMGGLAQRLVRELGMPAVLAMNEKISIKTAGKLSRQFYHFLRLHGLPDRALVETMTALADTIDATVPAIYSRLGGRPLFSDTTDRDLTLSEIQDGLSILDTFLTQRAPVLRETARNFGAVLRKSLPADRESMSQAARQECEQALREIDTICDEVLDLGFHALALGQEPPEVETIQPFRGLLPFFPEHSKFFFGREELVEKLIHRLSEHPFLAVLGASGSGKSSVVLAGLIPALEKRDPDIKMVYLTPGTSPLERLAAACQSVTGYEHAILVLDQFEEIFTQCHDEIERAAFMAKLLEITLSTRTVITMRADFWGDCARYPALKILVQEHQELIAPMTIIELRSAIEQQAKVASLRFEADLTHTILDAVQEEPGAMPLLQHLLKELYDRRHGRWLLTTEYYALGGIKASIAHTAESLYEEFTSTERDRMKRVFLRLTRLGEDPGSGASRDTRQKVKLEEFYEEGQDTGMIRKVIQDLEKARLVVDHTTQLLDGTTTTDLEVAHEALIQYWPRLRGWIEENRKILRLHQEIRQAANDWAANEENSAYLIHRGQRLDDAAALVRQKQLNLNSREIAYLQACEQSQAREAEERLKDIGEMGWGVIFAADADPEIMEAMSELLALRKKQAGDRYQEFSGKKGYQKGEGIWPFLFRQGIAFGRSDLDKVPHYLLIVGDPEKIPFEFQYQLTLQYAVGRIHFDTPEEYRRYARSVVLAETGPVRRSRRAVVFAPVHPEDVVTDINAGLFAKPLAQALSDQFIDWRIERAIHEQAVRKNLIKYMNGDGLPAVLFAVGYGIYHSNPEKQRSLSGSFICQDWQGPSMAAQTQWEDVTFSGDSVPEDARLQGMITFLIAPYSAGVPRTEITHGTSFKLNDLTATEFLSRLPQRLLSHPAGGALAVVGHVGSTWARGYGGAKNVDDVPLFVRVLERTFQGFPIGAAMEPVFRRFAEYSAEINSTLESILLSDGEVNAEQLQKLRIYQDARGYLIIGDPAVRLQVQPPTIRLSVSPEDLHSAQLRIPANDAPRAWSVVFAQNADPAIRDALHELLEYRKLCGFSYQEYHGEDGYHPDETVGEFIYRHYQATGVTGPAAREQLFFIVGEPKDIPFEFQQGLSRWGGVGRVCFPSPEMYANYARSLVSAEAGSFRLPRKVTFFSPAHVGDQATRWSSTVMIPKLSDAFASEFPEWERAQVLAKDATVKQLKKIMAGDERPAFVFITCQAYTGKQPYTGAVICQDLPKFSSSKLEVQPEYMYSGEDVNPDDTPFGTISFIFTSSSAGTENAVAVLPQRLMGHPNGGSLAVIGCLEKLFLGTNFNAFLDRSVTTEAFLEPYSKWIAGLARGLPVGSAVAALRGDTSVSTRWVILGDPAVHLMV